VLLRHCLFRRLLVVFTHSCFEYPQLFSRIAFAFVLLRYYDFVQTLPNCVHTVVLSTHYLLSELYLLLCLRQFDAAKVDTVS